MEKQIINEKKVFLRLINIKVFNCKYEEKNREKRKSKSGNFQTLIPRDILDEITLFLIRTEYPRRFYLKWYESS